MHMTGFSRWGRWAAGTVMMLVLLTAVASVAHAAEPDLATAIENLLRNLVKFVRWGALAALAGAFLWQWAEKVQNRDNHHAVVAATRNMWIAGLGFTVVALYRLVLTGIVALTGAGTDVIPSWLWG